jgi:hypothetical protein
VTEVTFAQPSNQCKLNITLIITRHVISVTSELRMCLWLAVLWVVMLYSLVGG